MFRKFASIAHSNEFGYGYDSQQWDGRAPIESNFRVFKNYGDGLTVHSPDWSVQLEQLPDFLMSLADAMRTDDELAQTLVFTFGRRPSVREIEFAASVVYKPHETQEWLKSRRWFSAKEMKVSKAPSKEHDKRYEEVRDIHDGSPNSIFRILIGEYSSGLVKYLYADAIRDWVLAADRDGLYMPLTAEFLKWTDDRDEARLLRDAFEACKHVTESYRLRMANESAIENYRRQIEPKPAPEPQVPAEPEAKEDAHAEAEKDVESAA
jgi:hypothetical protein